MWEYFGGNLYPRKFLLSKSFFDFVYFKQKQARKNNREKQNILSFF